MNRGAFLVSLLVLVAYMVIAGVLIRWCVPTGGKLSTADRLCGREVKTMRTALLMAIAVAGCAGSGVDSQGLLPPGMRVPTPVEQMDAGDSLLMAAADTLADLGLQTAADALVPATDAQPERRIFPACADVGFHEAPLSSCEDRRTRDQGYSCGTCGAPPPRPCVSSQPHPGDLPWLCVASCGDCAAVVKCTGKNMCMVVRYDDGGAL